MRILLLTDAFPPEVRSSSHLMYELAEDLRARGHAVSVVTCRPRYNLAPAAAAPPASPGVQREQMGGFEVLRVDAPAIHNVGHVRRGLGQLWLPVAFYRAARALPRPDVIYVYSPPLTLGLAAHWLGRRWRAPFVFNVQDLFPQNAIDLGALRNPVLIAFFRNLERFIYRRAAAIALHSEGNAAWLRRDGVEAAKLRVVHNWVDTETHRPGTDATSNRFRKGFEGRFVVLFAGVMGYAQDMETIVEAAARLREEPRIVFLLVGDGSERAGVERRVRELGLDNVRLLPFVSREDYPQIVAACDVGLVTLKKTMKTPVVPSKLPTYMASARPVIVSVNPESDAGALVRAADCGLLVPPGDPEAMAAAIRSLLNDPARASALGARGREYALRHLTRRACIDEIERLLTACAAGRGPEATFHAPHPS